MRLDWKLIELFRLGAGRRNDRPHYIHSPRIRYAPICNRVDIKLTGYALDLTERMSTVFSWRSKGSYNIALAYMLDYKVLILRLLNIYSFVHWLNCELSVD